MKKLSKRTKRISTAVAVVAIVGAGGGAAWAYWTSSGNGAGAGTTGASTAFTVAVGGVTGPTLTPGGPSQTVAFTVTNPGTGSQNLAGVVVTVANADGTPWTAVTGCSAADYAIGTTTITGGAGQIAPGGNKPGTVVVSMNNLSSNQNACQGVAYPLYVAAS